MNREEFMRQMGLSKDDVADPEVIVANLKEKRLGGAQSSYFAKAKEKASFPGFASATSGLPPARELPSTVDPKYDKYVKSRVENVVSGKVDDADEAYMNYAKQKQQSNNNNDRSAQQRDEEAPPMSALDRERAREREEEREREAVAEVLARRQQQKRGGDAQQYEEGNGANATPPSSSLPPNARRSSYGDKTDWISKASRNAYDDDDDGDRSNFSKNKSTSEKGRSIPSAGATAAEIDDTEPLVPRKQALQQGINENISVAQRIAQSSRMFYGAGESDDDDDNDGSRGALKKKGGAAPQQAPSSSASDRAAFLKSLGIDNMNDTNNQAPTARGGGGGGGGGAPPKSVGFEAGGGVSISETIALTGAGRTEALSNAVAARRMARKAAAAAAAAGGGGGGGGDDAAASYQPPRSAPSAMDIVPPSQAQRSVAGPSVPKAKASDEQNQHYDSFVPSTTVGGPSSPSRQQQQFQQRASSEPSGDQKLHTAYQRGAPARVTVPSSDYDYDYGKGERGGLSGGERGAGRVPELNASRVAFGIGANNNNEGHRTPHRAYTPSAGEGKVESPTAVVNELLFGGGTRGIVSNNTKSNPYPPARGAPSTTYRGANNNNNDSNSSSLNSTMNNTTASAKLGASYGGTAAASAAEYDPETANLSPEELKVLGNKSFENGDFRKAVRYYSKAISKDPSNAALYSNRSAAYLQASKQMGMDTRSMALRDAEKTIEIRPDWFKGYSRKGDALFKMEKYDDAIDAYEQGLSFDEGNPSLIHSIGEARNANGGIARRDKKDTPWAIEQRTNTKISYGDRTASELVDMNRGQLNEALGTLVMGDEYRKQQLEQFRNKGGPSSSSTGSSSNNMRASSGRPADVTASSSGAGAGGGGGAGSNNTNTGPKSLLDMIRSNSPKDSSIPMNNSNIEYGRRANNNTKEPLPEQLTSDAAISYQNAMYEKYMARKAAAANK